MTADITTICEMIRKVTGRDIREQEVTRGTSYLDDLHLTSIQTIDLVMSIEDRYGIEVEDVDLGKLRTVGQTIEYIATKTHAT